MANKCRGCGAEALRTLTTLHPQTAEFMKEVCRACAPEMFDGAFRAPSDSKVYTGPQAHPTLYTRDSEGVYHAKDELIQDTVDTWDKGPTQKNIDNKRATRRTAPMSADEIRKTQNWGDECLKPILTS